MNKKLFLIILIGLIQIGNIFGATKSEEPLPSSSSSSSSSLSSKSSTPSVSVSSSISSDLDEGSTSGESQQTGKKIELTTPQKQTLEQFKTTPVLKSLPISLLELTAGYSGFTKEEVEKATKDLWSVIKNEEISELERIEKAKEAIKNGADINKEDEKVNPLLHVTYLLKNLFKHNYGYIDKYAQEYLNLIEILINGTTLEGINNETMDDYNNTLRTPLLNLLEAFEYVFDKKGNIKPKLKSITDKLIEMIKSLLEKDANPNKITSYNVTFTPLLNLLVLIDLELFNNNPIKNQESMKLKARVINLLLDHKADPNLGITFGRETFIDVLNGLFEKNPEVMNATMSEVRDKVMKTTSSNSSSLSSSSRNPFKEFEVRI